MNPRVSIITPSLGQGAFVGETITSVLSQDYPHVPRGDILVWLNSDDTCNPGAITAVVEYFSRHAEAVMRSVLY
jgi:hypothetical protein